VATSPEREIKRRMPAAARRERVLAAALDAFASGGYASTSMGEIAGRAGVTRAVLYDHFASKQSLYLAVLEERNRAFLAHVGARITGGGSARDRMRETIETVFGFAEREPAAWQLLFGDGASGDPAVEKARRRVHDDLAAAVRALLAADAKAAGIDPEGPQAAAIVEMLIAALRGAVDWRRRHPEADSEQLTDAAMNLLWSGLGATPGQR
jgi:AcrR family transcriptional regulator